jgi:hypothetical protein
MIHSTYDDDETSIIIIRPEYETPPDLEQERPSRHPPRIRMPRQGWWCRVTCGH